MTEATVICGDCLDAMAEMDANSVDTVICDPPYGLEFMGKDWDHGVPGVRFWQAALRVAKPGAMLLAFGGTRTHHRLMVAIEDAGWELRDVVMWLYGSGFPKSHDISKAIDKAAGAEREVVGDKLDRPGYHLHDSPASIYGNGTGLCDGVGARVAAASLTAPATPAAAEWEGWGTALKPAWEPIVVAMAPRDGTFAHNAQKWGVAGLWIDGGRVPTGGEAVQINTWDDGAKPFGNGAGHPYSGREETSGRWPANVVLDEEAGALLDEQSGERAAGGYPKLEGTFTGKSPITFRGAEQRDKRVTLDSGGASRFFYTAKASRAERDAGLEGMEKGPPPASARSKPARGRTSALGAPRRNHHPTVKPVALMRYLVRLTKTPTGGVVLDPFAGSGSTGVACVKEGRDFIGIELSDEYCEIARRRIEHAGLQPPLEGML